MVVGTVAQEMRQVRHKLTRQIMQLAARLVIQISALAEQSFRTHLQVISSKTDHEDLSMTFTTLRWLSIGLLLLTVEITHAEGGCPAGYYPIGASSGQPGPQGCAPIPEYNQQPVPTTQPRPQWVSRWGAIATYAPTGILGVATDQGSKNEAERKALLDCKLKGGPTCTIEVAYDNECAAVVVGDKGYNVNTDATVEAAVQYGMKTCSNAGGSGCHAYYTACSLPVQIQ